MYAHSLTNDPHMGPSRGCPGLRMKQCGPCGWTCYLGRNFCLSVSSMQTPGAGGCVWAQLGPCDIWGAGHKPALWAGVDPALGIAVAARWPGEGRGHSVSSPQQPQGLGPNLPPWPLAKATLPVYLQKGRGTCGAGVTDLLRSSALHRGLPHARGARAAGTQVRRARPPP